MAKALYGQIGTDDRQVAQELSRARGRLRALESEVARLRAENDRLAEALAETGDGERLSR
jgi:hypothetical protein